MDAEEIALMTAAATAAATLVSIMDDVMDDDCNDVGGEQSLLHHLQQEVEEEKLITTTFGFENKGLPKQEKWEIWRVQHT